MIQIDNKIKCYLLLFQEQPKIRISSILICSQNYIYQYLMIIRVATRLRKTSSLFTQTTRLSIIEPNHFITTHKASQLSYETNFKEQIQTQLQKKKLRYEQLQAKNKQLKKATNLTSLLNVVTDQQLDSLQNYRYIFHKLSDNDFGSFQEILSEVDRLTRLVVELRNRSWDISQSNQKILNLYYFLFKLWHAQKCKHRKNYFSFLSNDYVQNYTQWVRDVTKANIQQQQQKHFFKGGYQSRLSMILTSSIKNKQSTLLEIGFIYFFSKIFTCLPNDHSVEIRKGISILIEQRNYQLKDIQNNQFDSIKLQQLKQKIRQYLHFVSIVMLGQRNIIKKNLIDIRLKSTILKVLSQILLAMQTNSTLKQIIQEEINKFPQLGIVNSWNGMMNNLILVYPFCPFNQHQQRIRILKFYTKKVCEIFLKNIPRNNNSIATNVMITEIAINIDQYNNIKVFHQQISQMEQLEKMIVDLFKSQLHQNGLLLQDAHQFSVFMYQAYRVLKTRMNANNKKVLIKYLCQGLTKKAKQVYQDYQLQEYVYSYFVKLIYQQFSEYSGKELMEGQIGMKQWSQILQKWIWEFQSNEVTFYSLYYVYIFLSKKLKTNPQHVQKIIDLNYLKTIKKKLEKNQFKKQLEHQEKAFLYTYDSQATMEQKQMIKFSIKFYGLLNLLKEIKIKVEPELHQQLEKYFMHKCKFSIKNVICTLFLSTFCFEQILSYRKLIQSEGYFIESRTKRRSNCLELLIVLQLKHNNVMDKIELDLDDKQTKYYAKLLQFTNTYKFYLNKQIFKTIQKQFIFMSIFNMVISQKRHDAIDLISVMSDNTKQYSRQMLQKNRNQPSQQSKLQRQIIKKLQQQIQIIDQKHIQTRFKSGQQVINGSFQIFSGRFIKLFPQNIQYMENVLLSCINYNLQKQKISIQSFPRILMDLQTLSKFKYEFVVGFTIEELSQQILNMDSFLYDKAYLIIKVLKKCLVAKSELKEEFLKSISELIINDQIVISYVNSFLTSSMVPSKITSQLCQQFKHQAEGIAIILRHPKLHREKYKLVQYFLDNFLVSEQLWCKVTYQSCKKVMLLVNSFNVLDRQSKIYEADKTDILAYSKIILQKLQQLVERAVTKQVLTGIDKFGAYQKLELIRKYLQISKPALNRTQRIFSKLNKNKNKTKQQQQIITNHQQNKEMTKKSLNKKLTQRIIKTINNDQTKPKQENMYSKNQQAKKKLFNKPQGTQK